MKKEKGQHERAPRNGELIGHLGVTANLKDGRISFNTKVRGDFKKFANNEMIKEIIKLQKLLEKEHKTTGEGLFHTKKFKTLKPSE